jgi:hypothetical protein
VLLLRLLPFTELGLILLLLSLLHGRWLIAGILGRMRARDWSVVLGMFQAHAVS